MKISIWNWLKSLFVKLKPVEIKAKQQEAAPEVTQRKTIKRWWR